jgi:toxin-antitoxin system PIN domain toxin
MIAIDTNLLVYAHREDSEFHEPARVALVNLAEGNQPWCIPWPCLHEFLSIVTHPRIYAPPSPMALALASIKAWIQSPGCVTIGEEADYFDILKKLAIEGRVAGPMIHDARIAAICIQNSVAALWTADRDFSRFASLKTRNPLV